MQTKMFKLSVLAATVLLGLAACGGGSGGSEPAGSGTASGQASGGNATLVYCSEGSPSGFDPAQWTDGASFDASAYPLYNGLVEFSRGGTDVVPGLIPASTSAWRIHLFMVIGWIPKSAAICSRVTPSSRF